tara:strand:+ start:237 stop:428 length:192 start_codon:yes stop_codon:yes gene_type:complete
MPEMPSYDIMEESYDMLARAVDAVGEARETAFFTKLVLTLADMLDDPTRFAAAVEIAQRDLDG